MDAPSGLITALKASLADVGAGWAVGAALQDPPQTPTRITVNVGSLKVRMAVGSRVGMQFTYIATVAAGSLTEATLIIAGAQYRTTDSTLHAAVMALASAWLTAKATSIADALTAGPQ